MQSCQFVHASGAPPSRNTRASARAHSRSWCHKVAACRGLPTVHRVSSATDRRTDAIHAEARTNMASPTLAPRVGQRSCASARSAATSYSEKRHVPGASGGLHANSFSRPSVHANCGCPNGVAKLELKDGGGVCVLRSPQCLHAAPAHSGAAVTHGCADRWPMGVVRLPARPASSATIDAPSTTKPAGSGGLPASSRSVGRMSIVDTG